MNEKFCILIRISLKLVPKGPIDNNSALLHVMGLAPNRRQAITWTNADTVYWCIYAALGAGKMSEVNEILVKVQLNPLLESLD